MCKHSEVDAENGGIMLAGVVVKKINCLTIPKRGRERDSKIPDIPGCDVPSGG